MTTLTCEQLAFLDQHEVPLHRTFDASGMKLSKYKEIMADSNLIIAYGVTDCRKGGHTLRNRSGQCVMCYPRSIGFLIRYDLEGIVYVAGSDQEKVVKIGITQDVGSRITQLNQNKYGGLSDWSEHFSKRTPLAGRVENLSHNLLKQYRVKKLYMVGDVPHECFELFECAVEEAIAVLVKSCDEIVHAMRCQSI